MIQIVNQNQYLMENFTKKFLWIACFMLSAGLFNAQDVSWTNESGLIESIGGTTPSDCAVDMNGDYLDDIVRILNNGVYIDFQQPDGTFDHQFFPMDVVNMPNWSIAAGDIDGNGYTDLMFGNGSRVSFVMANEDGTAYTEDDRPEYIFCQRGTLNDIDNDGNLDAFMNHDVDQCHPYRNDGTGYLVLDQSLIETLDVGGNYANIWCDYDNDGDSDLLITKCRGGAPWGDAQRVNLHYRNNGDGSYTEVGEESGLNDGNQGWATVFEDFDNDGDFDVFTVNHSSSDVPGGAMNMFFENNGDGTYTDITISTDINPYALGAWNCDAGDFNNDGFVDILSEMGGGQDIWFNDGDMTFTSYNANFDSGGIGDFNDDGFLDVVAGNNVYINDGNDNNWIKVGCEGIISNKNGIGARIEIHGDWGIQVREIRAGESFDPMSSLVEHFGLGTADEIDQLIVKWPSGMITTIDNPDVNTTYIVPEADCLAEPNEIAVDGDTEICEGQSVTLTADAGDTYTWSDGSDSQSIDVTEAGVYSVVIYDDEGCASISNNISISMVQEIMPTIDVLGEEQFCDGGNVVLSAEGGEDYTWSNDVEGGSIVVTESGDYSVSYVGVCGVDLESDMVSIIVMDPAEPVADNVEVGEVGEVTLSAMGDDLAWYMTEVSTEVLGTGPDFTFDMVDDNESRWVENTEIFGGEIGDGGKDDDAGGGGLPSSGGVLYFDTWEAFTLQTVTIYIPSGAGDGDRDIWIKDASDAVIASGSFYLEEGENQVDLNFEVPVGTGLQIGADQNNMFRNNGGVNYPYDIADVGSITTSTYGDSYYYYFYAWVIQKESVSCTSDRIEVFATVVGVEELDGISNLTLYPNPVMDELTVNFEAVSNSTISIEITDVTGKVVFTESLGTLTNGNHNKVIDMSGYASGMYQLSFVSNDSRVVKQITVN